MVSAATSAVARRLAGRDLPPGQHDLPPRGHASGAPLLRTMVAAPPEVLSASHIEHPEGPQHGSRHAAPHRWHMACNYKQAFLQLEIIECQATI
jgi:hypothetical protein